MRKNLFYFTLILMLIMGGKSFAASGDIEKILLEKPTVSGTYTKE